MQGAKDVGVEFFSMSKSYNMAGLARRLLRRQPRMIARWPLKSYFDYGMFQPVQIASIIALNGPQECGPESAEKYRRAATC